MSITDIKVSIAKWLLRGVSNEYITRLKKEYSINGCLDTSCISKEYEKRALETLALLSTHSKVCDCAIDTDTTALSIIEDIKKILNKEPLSPLTDNDDEWTPAEEFLAEKPDKPLNFEMSDRCRCVYREKTDNGYDYHFSLATRVVNKYNYKLISRKKIAEDTESVVLPALTQSILIYKDDKFSYVKPVIKDLSKFAMKEYTLDGVSVTFFNDMFNSNQTITFVSYDTIEKSGMLDEYELKDGESLSEGFEMRVRINDKTELMKYCDILRMTVKEHVKALKKK